jgi:glycine C-acetyltransferase
MEQFIRDELSRLSASGLRRAPALVEGPQGPRVRVNGRDVVLLCSNDYLGLANDPRVKKAAAEAIERYGAGSGGSRLTSGTMEPHVELEERIRTFKGAEAALLFNSGYNANLGCITALAGRGCEVFSDRLNHASIVDACALSRASVSRYRHRDLAHLEDLLKRSKARQRLIVTDGVFSMDGVVAPIKEMTGLLDRYGATLMVDDAHGTGVLGGRGRGTLEHLGVSHPSIIHMGTLGKALGSFGAFIAGAGELKDLLISRARPFMFTTALPPSVCAAAAKAIDLVEEAPGLRAKLHENAAFMRDGLGRAGLDTMGSSTQIIPVLAGDARMATAISSTLLERGVFIQAIRPPAVPAGTSRLRISVTAAHSREDLASALEAVKDAFSAVRRSMPEGADAKGAR